MNINLKSIGATAAIILVSFVAYSQITTFLEQRRQIEDQRQAIKKNVAENTEGAAQILKIEISPNSITFGELFERGDDRVKKLSDAIIPIGISSLPKDERESLKTYIEGLQETLRLQVAKNRKVMVVSNAIDRAKEAQHQYANETNEYSIKYARTRAQDALDEAKKALDESTKASKDFRDSLKSFRDTLNVIRPKLKEYDILEDSMLSSVIQRQPT